MTWSPAQLSLEQPPAMHRAIDYLQELARYRRLDISAVQDWRPQPGAIAALEFALEHNEAGWAKDALLDSLHDSMRMIRHLNQGVVAAASPTDIVSAMEQMHRALLGDDSALNQRRQREAVLKYVEIAAGQLLPPIMRRAQAAADPLERSLWVQFAELNSLFVAQAPLASRHLLRSVAQGGGDPVSDTKAIPELLAMSSRLVTLAKELSKCKKSSPSPMASRTVLPPLNLSRRFANSDLAMQN